MIKMAILLKAIYKFNKTSTKIVVNSSKNTKDHKEPKQIWAERAVLEVLYVIPGLKFYILQSQDVSKL